MAFAFDNMTEILRGDGMKYALAYDAYHNLESIGVYGKNEKLVKYCFRATPFIRKKAKPFIILKN